MGSEVTNVLLVSGPRGTGRNALVKQLMKEVVTTADGEIEFIFKILYNLKR